MSTTVNSCLPNSPFVNGTPPKGAVNVDGKTYTVKTVQDNNPLVKHIMPAYKDVIEINGKQYDIIDENNTLGMKKVVVNGKMHIVWDSELTARLVNSFQQNFQDKKANNLNIEA